MKVAVQTALLSLQAATVLAAPVINGNPLFARQQTQIYGPVEGGFATVEYGDGKLNYGARVPSTVLDVINDECGQTSCNPSGGFGFSTLVVNSDRGNDVSYTISVEGSFALAGERGDKAQLLELAGYRTQLVEFVELEHTPKNVLIRAVRGGRTTPETRRAYEELRDALGLEPTLERLLSAG